MPITASTTPQQQHLHPLFPHNLAPDSYFANQLQTNTLADLGYTNNINTIHPFFTNAPPLPHSPHFFTLFTLFYNFPSFLPLCPLLAPSTIIASMKVIDKLLQPVPTQQLKDYESHLQLHLKLILTTINKHALEDTTPVQTRKYRCYLGCYDFFSQQTTTPSKAEQWERVEQLRSCKEKCGGESRQIEKFLDNINFYSKRKLSNCSKSCLKAGEEERNSCLWECHNRLDRRYKQYWSTQRSNIEAKYKI